jgi:3,4-dihydroxy 2-butanone 4-phosphate synthase/GTP cyclohydrolase II
VAEHSGAGERTRLDQVGDALTALRAGQPVIVVDDEDRENEGDFVVAAELATASVLGFMIRHSSGMVCAPMAGADLDRLEIALMSARNTDPFRTAYTVTVDAATGVGTGISASDRARTGRVLADPSTTPADLTLPGHVFPLRARDGGVITRPGHTEAAVDLTRLAGLRPVGMIAEVVEDDGSMMRGPQLRRLADEHGLVMISIAQLIQHRIRTEPLVQRLSETTLPTRYGRFRAIGYASAVDGHDHVALVHGDLTGATEALVRIHSECLTGDVLGSQRCDCGDQLAESLRRIADVEAGVLVYLRGQEGRGIGLAAKLAAYALQDSGLDTVDANLELGFPVDGRQYGSAAQILRDLGVRSVRLLTNNPDKVQALAAAGMPVSAREPVLTAPTSANVDYLRTKRDRLGHALPTIAAAVS